ncbi:hypothetical protein ZHAS_00018872 [Anopheles sinensis]|uniref:Uncharacterized protein n=1 Tax=Anopheles sinensis TaxID=74873 RepID=A0A084WKS4_ANOSI|nr:hypothetical protein ZHAS_00018872 [Anopheles sinensis]
MAADDLKDPALEHESDAPAPLIAAYGRKGHPRGRKMKILHQQNWLNFGNLNPQADRKQTQHAPREAYRRWGCSVFIPYFASREDIKSVNNKTGNRDSDRATQGKSNANHGTAANKQTEPNLSDANKQQLTTSVRKKTPKTLVKRGSIGLGCAFPSKTMGRNVVNK